MGKTSGAKFADVTTSAGAGDPPEQPYNPDIRLRIPPRTPAGVEGLVIAAHRGSNYRRWLGFREPVSEAEEGADFPAFIPALLDLRGPHIREAECIFVISNGVDHRVG
jgi:hypothetical protein